ncbi:MULTISPECIES: restriction endonuclease [unclassified Mesorhizobium]|uniref:restriction endonuclease n=1 Tax=unclassified Mesorhizobium TaxID=325217 RepID=UPI000FD5236F|nr:MULTISPECIES: restriction endonuclease [unclassified Mesorhizobium]RUV95285.1 restriction endonuclease [Mesorhizobium sp. M5C.F.Ca.IN.020.14.1.1]RUV29149.1 restriction endonuclease [Mesorhizobium sp. M5C.F.Ca.IN.020.32.2.1]RWG46146.1 MAG: restriction endonuclease [Mesorhizobium sp.]RWH48901.1 MAG: restriction endonuclease [Mesorhizobium sp.]RWH60273.1 MAG: restriction endonuclease [Mesorhizobium sp.]
MVQVPAYTQMMWPAIDALKELGGSAANDELLTKVIEVMRLPPEVQNIPHTDGRQSKVSYNLHWAKTYLKKAGYVDNSVRGVWALTDAGETCTQQDVALVPALVRKMAADAKKNGLGDGEEPVVDAVDALEVNWKDQLLDCLKSIKPDAFERLSQRLLREAGFIKVEVTGRSGDGGIDGIGVLRLNLLSFQVLFQCKRYSGSVGPSTIRDFRGAMVGRSDKGLLITTGTFTAEAKKEATRDGAPAIELIDGEQFCDLLKQLKLGVATEMVERVVVDPGWFSKV